MISIASKRPTKHPHLVDYVHNFPYKYWEIPGIPVVYQRIAPIKEYGDIIDQVNDEVNELNEGSDQDAKPVVTLDVLVHYLNHDLALWRRHVVASLREEEDQLHEVDEVSLVRQRRGHLVDETDDASEDSHALDGAVLSTALRHLEKSIHKSVLDHVTEVSILLYPSVVPPGHVPCLQQFGNFLSLICHLAIAN